MLETIAVKLKVNAFGSMYSEQMGSARKFVGICGIFSLKALNYTQHYILVNIAVRFNYLFYFILKH